MRLLTTHLTKLADCEVQIAWLLTSTYSYSLPTCLKFVKASTVTHLLLFDAARRLQQRVPPFEMSLCLHACSREVGGVGSSPNPPVYRQHPPPVSPVLGLAGCLPKCILTLGVSVPINQSERRGWGLLEYRWKKHNSRKQPSLKQVQANNSLSNIVQLYLE